MEVFITKDQVYHSTFLDKSLSHPSKKEILSLTHYEKDFDSSPLSYINFRSYCFFSEYQANWF